MHWTASYAYMNLRSTQTGEWVDSHDSIHQNWQRSYIKLIWIVAEHLVLLLLKLHTKPQQHLASFLQLFLKLSIPNLYIRTYCKHININRHYEAKKPHNNWISFFAPFYLKFVCEWLIGKEKHKNSQVHWTAGCIYESSQHPNWECMDSHDSIQQTWQCRYIKLIWIVATPKLENRWIPMMAYTKPDNAAIQNDNGVAIHLIAKK